MSTPPPFAAWLLAAALPSRDRDFVLGDLAEEFATVIAPHHGRRRANWWYRRQVACSLAPLVCRAWERASLARASTAIAGAAVTASLPASMLILMRSFVLQQVPLKTTAEPSVSFLVLLAALVLVAAGAGVAAAIRILDTGARQR
jgi:hypothetical protein